MGGVASPVGCRVGERGVGGWRASLTKWSRSRATWIPQDLDAEGSVLGAMMLSTEAIAEVVESLDAEDFYRSANGKIYQACGCCYAQGEPVDIVTGSRR